MGVGVFLSGFRSLFCVFDRIFTDYLGHDDPLTQWIYHDSMVSNCQELFRVLAYIGEGQHTKRTFTHAKPRSLRLTTPGLSVVLFCLNRILCY